MKMELEAQNKRELSRERERDRSRRSDRPSRFSDVGSREKSRDREEHKRSAYRRLYVSNIPYEYRWQELKDLFREQVGEVAYVELFYDENEKSRGCGIIEFATDELVNKAMEIMQRFDVNGRKLNLKEDNRNERDKFGYIIKPGKRSGDRRSDQREEPRRSNMNFNDHHNVNESGSSANYNTFGLSVSFLENLGITEPLQSRVFVANLDYKVDAKKLKEVFRLAGKVQNVDLSVDKDGNSRGFAVIEFDHPVESVQAISMLDRQMLYDRRMTVRMDRAAEKLDHSRLPEGLKGIGQGLGPGGEPLRDVAHNLPNVTSANAPPINPIIPQQQTPNVLSTGIPQGLNLAALSNVVGGNLANLGTIQSLAGSLGLSNPLLALGGGDLSSLGIGASLANAGSLSSLNSAALNVGNNLTAGNLAAINNLTTAQNSQMSSFNRDNILSQNQSFDLASNNASNNTGGYLSGNFSNRDSHSHGYNTNQSGKDNYRSSDLFNSLGNNSVNRLSSSDIMKQGDGLNNRSSGMHSQVSSDQLLVSNLPGNCAWSDLRDKFRDIAGIKTFEMRTKDTAILRFSNSAQAERARKMMDGSRFGGRTMNISYF